MAGQRLPEKNEKTSGFSFAHIFHLVDESDTTDHASGSSFQAKLGNFLKELGAIQLNGCLVIKKNASPVYTSIQDDDWVFYMSDTRLIVGVPKATITTVPTDLDDDTKFIKFLDNTPLL
ncbi:MAG: hypothetical protein NXH86_04035 [Flavobacteriaceae bacterium]|nr:hypothetical protein [Flavobacteriaceae bacterium]